MKIDWCGRLWILIMDQMDVLKYKLWKRKRRKNNKIVHTKTPLE